METPARETGNDRAIDFSEFMRSPNRYAAISKLILRDLNSNANTTPFFSLYSKDEIQQYLSNPYSYEKNLRDAVIYMYGASPHFKRLIQYFAGLSDLAYVISPYNIDPQKANVTTVSRNYRKTLAALSGMSIKTQFPKILTVCLREDVFYGTLWVTQNSIMVQRLPSDYCTISTIEDNVPNVTFDFSYFDSHQSLLDFYPEEFRTKYENVYKKNTVNRWIELDSPTSFAIKSNNDILDYAMPPFAGILREVYELEDYKQLRKSKTRLENYAMIDMQLPMNDDGEWLLDYNKAKEFWNNLDSVLPDEIGSVLTPMKLNKTSFEKANAGDTNTVADAEQNLFSAAGVSSLLFNNAKASANALTLSIKADQALTFGIVKSIEDVVNRYIHGQSYGKNFKVTFIDCSPFNRKEVGDQYLKAAQYGLPTIMLYAASQGLGQAEMDSMNFLENEVLELKKVLVPLKGSSTLSKNDLENNGATDEGGAPEKSIEELTESGEQSRDSDS